MKIICLGDSLTAGCGLRRGENWVELLREQTGDEWINAGVCGDTSTGILVRLQTEVLPQRPDEVLLMGGDNDIMLTGCADQAKSAMMAMIHQCAARGVKPVVGIQFPVLGIPEPWRAVCDWERAQAESAAYIAWLRRLVRAVSLRHVDFAEAFERCGGRALDVALRVRKSQTAARAGDGDLRLCHAFFLTVVLRAAGFLAAAAARFSFCLSSCS